MGLVEDFALAAEEATKLPEAVNNQDKLKLYGLYKQASVGDVSTGTVWTPSQRRWKYFSPTVITYCFIIYLKTFLFAAYQWFGCCIVYCSEPCSFSRFKPRASWWLLVAFELMSRLVCWGDRLLRSQGALRVWFRHAERPGMFDQKGRAKWDAWSAVKGVTSMICGYPYFDKWCFFKIVQTWTSTVVVRIHRFEPSRLQCAKHCFPSFNSGKS